MNNPRRMGLQRRHRLLSVLVPALVLGALAAVVVALIAGRPAGNSTGAAGAPAGSDDQTLMTSFGMVQVGAVTRSRGDTAAQHGAHGSQGSHGTGNENGAGDSSTYVAPHHQVWNGQVRVNVTVQNTSERPVLFSPGQLRLSLEGSGPTVAPLDAGQPPGTVEPVGSVSTWVSFRVPPHTEDPWLEFRDVLPRPPQLLQLDTGPGQAPGGGHHHD